MLLIPIFYAIKWTDKSQPQYCGIEYFGRDSFGNVIPFTKWEHVEKRMKELEMHHDMQVITWSPDIEE